MPLPVLESLPSNRLSAKTSDGYSKTGTYEIHPGTNKKSLRNVLFGWDCFCCQGYLRLVLLGKYKKMVHKIV